MPSARFFLVSVRELGAGWEGEVIRVPLAYMRLVCDHHTRRVHSGQRLGDTF